VGNTLLRLLDRLRAHPGQGPAADPARRAVGGPVAAPGLCAGATLPYPGGPLQAHVPSAADLASDGACDVDQDAVAAAVLLLLQECAAGQPPRQTAAVLAAWAAGDAGPALQRAAEVEVLHMRMAGVRVSGIP